MARPNRGKMHSFDQISSPDLEVGLEDDVLLTTNAMTSTHPSSSSSPHWRTQYPVPKWMRSSSSSSSTPYSLLPLLSYLRDHVYPFAIRSTSSLLQRLAPLLRPRLTVRYILVTFLAIYTLYCFLTSQPLLASRLPGYTGPHGVGAVDIEVPLDEPQRINDITFLQDGKPAFEVETVLFTLYYPTDKERRSSSGGDKLSWIPSPISATAKGYAHFLGMDNFLVRGMLTAGLWLVSPWGIPIPAQVGAPLLPPPPPPPPTITPNDDVAADVATEKLLPVVVFTHGMLSSRTDYTSYLGELASRGIVVAAVEHRDGSSPGSAIRRRKDGRPADEKWRFWFGLRDLDTTGHQGFDTAAFKESQLSFREAEILAAARVLRDLNDPSTHAEHTIASQNSRQPIFPSSPDFLSTFQSRLNTTHVLLGGHSYGATGALRALRPISSSFTSPFKAGLILDPGKSSGPLNADISVPLLIAHSSSWSAKHSVFFGRPHFDVVREIAEGVNERCANSDDANNINKNNQEEEEQGKEGKGSEQCASNAEAWFLTSLGTSHPSITDAPLLEPFLLSWTTGSTMDAQDGIRQYVDLTRDFVNYQHTGSRGEGLLALSDGDGVAEGKGGVTVKEYDPKHNDKMPGGYRKYWQLHVTPD